MNTPVLYPMQLSPVCKSTIWGGNRMRDCFGFQTKLDNIAEAWMMSARDDNPGFIIEDGVAKLPDRSSFAGSIATVATVLEKGVRHYGLSLENTLTMLTETPAAIMHLSNKGKIKDGNDADIVLFDKDLHVQNVFLGGEMVK